MNREAIETFVRQRLGCGCPDEVFRDITQEWPGVHGEDGFDQRLRIGGRLLIDIVRLESIAQAQAGLETLLRAGRAERDRAGYNRFRLVLRLPEDQAGWQGLQARFATWAHGDEHIHLHLMALQEPLGF